MQHAMAAAQEALSDAKWQPEDEHEKEMTVCQAKPPYSLAMDRMLILAGCHPRLWYRQLRRSL